MNMSRRFVGRQGQLSCRQVGKVLQSYLDNELDHRAASKMAAHLEDCRRCGLEADAFEALRLSLQRAPSGLSDEPIARLREFGKQLARGDLDPDGLASS